MFRSSRLSPLIRSRLFLNRMCRTSSAETSCPAVPSPHDATSSEKTLIPEYLRYKENASSWEKFKRFLQGDTAPMLPCVIALIGGHIYIGWYLFGGEFEDDFEDEKVKYLSAFVDNTRARYNKVVSWVRGESAAKSEVDETETMISS